MSRSRFLEASIKFFPGMTVEIKPAEVPASAQVILKAIAADPRATVFSVVRYRDSDDDPLVGVVVHNDGATAMCCWLSPDHLIVPPLPEVDA